MGADLILARMRLDVERDVALRRLDEYTFDELSAAYTDALGIDYAELHGEQPSIDDLRDIARQGIDMAYSDRRDVVIWDFGGVTYSIMGETSWGDMPPEYDAFCMATALGVTEQTEEGES